MTSTVKIVSDLTSWCQQSESSQIFDQSANTYAYLPKMKFLVVFSHISKKVTLLKSRDRRFDRRDNNDEIMCVSSCNIALLTGVGTIDTTFE